MPPSIAAFTFDFFDEDLANDAFLGLFEVAADMAPTLIIMEDLDRVFLRRVMDEKKKPNVSLECLLNCLDGVVSHDGVIVVATASRTAARRVLPENDLWFPER